TFRAARNTKLGMAALPKRRSVRVGWLAVATARLGEARSARARRWSLARLADRPRSLDQTDDRSAEPPGMVVRVRTLLRLPVVAGQVIDRRCGNRLGRGPLRAGAGALCVRVAR